MGPVRFTTFLAFRPDLAMDRFVYVSKILLMMFLATSLINTDERLHLFLRVIALSLGFYALKGVFFNPERWELYRLGAGGYVSLDQ